MAEQPTQPLIESDRREADHAQFAELIQRYAEAARQSEQLVTTHEGTAFQDGDQLDLHQSQLGAVAHTKTTLNRQSQEQPLDPDVERIRWVKEAGTALTNIRIEAQSPAFWETTA